MKKTLPLFVLSVLFGLSTSAQTVLYDGFDVPGDYADATSLNGVNGGTGFDAWLATDVHSVSASLSYSGGANSLQTTDGASRHTSSGFDTTDRNFAVQDVENTTIYFSMLYEAATDNNLHYPLVLQSSNRPNQFIQLREESTGSGQLGLFLNLSGSVDNTHEQWGSYVPFAKNTTHLIVGALEVTAGGSDTLRIWLNPADLTDVANLPPVWTVSEGEDFLGGASNPVGIFTPVDGIRFVSNLTVTRDELRIAHGAGADFSDVLPLVTVPPTVIYEGFETPGDYVSQASVNGQSGGTGFFGSWNTTQYHSQEDGLSYLDLDATDGGMARDLTTYGSANREIASSAINGTIFFSILYQSGFKSDGSSDENTLDEVLSLSGDGVGQKNYILRNNGKGQITLLIKSLGGNSSSHEEIDTTVGLNMRTSPVLIIGHLVTGTVSDSLTLYFNPSDLTDVAGTAADTISVLESAIPDGGTLSGIRYINIGSTAQTHTWDEFRLAHSGDVAISDVVPTATVVAPPDPGSPVTPNVLFICVDDMKPLIGSYGASDVSTPNMDTLSSQGIQFNRAYVQQAVCTPSRVNLLTGLRPDTTRVYDVATNFRDTIPWATTLPEYLRNYGYHATALGKVFHSSTKENFDSTNPTERFSWDIDDLAWGHSFEDYLFSDGSAGDSPAYEIGSIDNLGVTTVADNAYGEGQIADGAVKKLAELKYKQPFFFAVGFNRPHLPFSAPKKYWDLYDPTGVDGSKIDLSADVALANDETPATNSPLYAYTFSGELRSYSNVPDSGALSASLKQNLVHGYYASVSYSDALVGQVLDALDAEGLTDDTIVVLWGDHGFHLGYNGQWVKKTNFETATRIPLIIRAPGYTADQETDALVETVDIFPTLMDLLGIDAPGWLEGTSLKPVLDDPANGSVRTSALSQYPRRSYEDDQSGADFGIDVMGYSIRTDRYRYIEWRRRDSDEVLAQELYDYDTDPTEDTNVAGHSANAELVAWFSDLLDDRVNEHKPVSSGMSVDLANNGDFSTNDTTSWTTSGASASFDASTGELAVTISSGGSQDSVVLSQSAPIDASRFYTIKFTARAAAEKTIGVVWKNGGTTYFDEDVVLGSTSANFQLDAIAVENLSGSDASAVLEFQLGGDADDVWIDNIEVICQSSLMRTIEDNMLSWSDDPDEVDDDGDQLSRLEEYASNLSFTSADYQILDPVSGTSGLPTGEVIASGADDKLRMAYIRRRDASDLVYTPEFSGDLGQADPWAASNVSETVTPIDSNWEKVTVEDEEDTSSASKRFGRVRIEYQPNATAQASLSASPLKIMRVGDSITRYVSSDSTLLDGLTDAGVDYELVGSQYWFSDSPDESASVDATEGYNGQRIQFFTTFQSAYGGTNTNGQKGVEFTNSIPIERACAAYSPDIVLLMVGVNDLGVADGVRESDATLTGYYGTLLDAIETHAPQAHTIVATVPPANNTIESNGNIADRNQEHTDFNTALVAYINGRIAAGDSISLVDPNSDMTANSAVHLDDIVHPNAAGQQIINEHWLEGIYSYLSTR